MSPWISICPFMLPIKSLHPRSLRPVLIGRSLATGFPPLVITTPSGPSLARIERHCSLNLQALIFCTISCCHGHFQCPAILLNDSAWAHHARNFRIPPGVFGSGYIEMLARQITADLQATRDATGSGESNALASKGISFGTIRRQPDGSWDVSAVDGLPAQSLATIGPNDPPSLVIRPFHQSGTAVSLREFTVNALNQHHGMQATERFGRETDPDGDGFTNEITRADVTATVLFQATLPAPGQVIPNNLAIEEAVFYGERLFEQIGCARCHVSKLPLTNDGWVFSEPNPYNSPDFLQRGQAETLSVDLSSNELPGHRLQAAGGVVWVRAFTDFKLHDITAGPDDPNAEALDINAPGGSEAFFAGNRRFLTKRLWGGANEAPFFHHGKFMTLREAIEAHAGEAQAERQAFRRLTAVDQSRVIEFLKSLQVMPEGFLHDICDEDGNLKVGWPPPSFWSWGFSGGGRRARSRVGP